jgi:hypothetical protein
VPVVRVFVSSVIKGMEPFREVAHQVIEAMSMATLNFEAFPASPSSPGKASLDEVRNADIFVQLIGEEISAIVEEEYETALEFLPDRILVFAKDARLSAPAMKHFNRLKRSHTYKKFKTVEDLKREIPYAINALVATTLRSKVRRRGSTVEEVLVDETVSMSVGDNVVWHFDLAEGDVVKGLISGSDTFHVYILDEEGYAEYLNDRESLEPDASEVRAHNVDEGIRRDDTYYFVVYCCAWLGTKAKVFLRRFSKSDDE